MVKMLRGKIYTVNQLFSRNRQIFTKEFSNFGLRLSFHMLSSKQEELEYEKEAT